MLHFLQECSFGCIALIFISRSVALWGPNPKRHCFLAICEAEPRPQSTT